MAVPIEQLEAQRKALMGHCYRMLGSVVDATDATQEAIIRAWRNAEKFDGRASVRTWLHRIATNVCLDEIDKRGRRARPMEEGPAAPTGRPPPEALTERPRTHWLEPIADACTVTADADPGERAIMKQTSSGGQRRRSPTRWRRRCQRSTARCSGRGRRRRTRRPTRRHPPTCRRRSRRWWIGISPPS